MADETTEGLSFLPEDYKGEDGTYDTERFRADYEALVSFKTQADEAAASLPTEASAYAFALPESHEWPEGFDPEQMKTRDADGNEVAFDPSKLIDPEDPDIALVQSALLEHKADPALAQAIASIFANREIRNVMRMQQEAEEQKGKLGPNGEARINTVARTIKARVPEAQANAILDGITSADALKGFEALLKAVSPATAPAPSKPDLSQMSIDERIEMGLKQRASARGK